MLRSPAKSTMIKETLLRQIKEGFFSRGALLPSERDLAVEYQVSHMTARKAVTALVAEKYLERRAGDGTYVRQDLADRQASRKLGIIFPAWESPELHDFMIYATELAEQQQWLSKAYFAKTWNDKTIMDALEDCDALMIWPPESLDAMPLKLRERLQQNSPSAVIIGQPGHVLGLDTVIGVDVQPVVMALEQFKKAGHKDVAFVIQQRHWENGLDPMDSYRDVWSQQLGLDEKKQRELLIQLEVPGYALPHKYLYDKIMEICRINNGHFPFTGIIIPLSLAWGAVAAFEDCGAKIPQDISIIAFGDRQEAEFYRPQLDMIKIPLQKHAKEAWRIINERLEHRTITKPKCLYVYPEYVAGKTILSINANA